MLRTIASLASALLLFIFSPLLFGADATVGSEEVIFDLTTSAVGYICLIVFVIAYALVIGEEYLHLRKSKPVLLAAGIIWTLIAIYYANLGYDKSFGEPSRQTLLGYADLLFSWSVALP